MITDNYIKMCEASEEIQKLQPHILTSTHLKGNIFICTDKESANYFWRIEVFNELPDDVGSPCYSHTRNIWLPTQEQLQEMILNHGHPGYDNGGILFGIMKFADDNKLGEISMNELWLAFVMKEKYNKVWTGEKWELYIT